MPQRQRKPQAARRAPWSFRTQTRGGCFCCAPPRGAGTIQASGGKNPLQTAPDQGKNELRLKDFKPRSTLRVSPSRIETPRFPVIDAHTHLTWPTHVRNGVSVGEDVTVFAKPDGLPTVMDRKGIRTLVDISARIGKLGRQPRAAQRFFDRCQDRILFDTDAEPSPYGDDVPQQLFRDELYEIYYRFLETEDECFDYAPAETPPQGRWSIYGIGLKDMILRKIYHDNVARLLDIRHE